MKRNKKVKNDNKPRLKDKRRFYRSNLSTIVWDSVKGVPLADFSAGHFTTDDPNTVGVLLGRGYVEIPLECSEPPAIIVNQPSASIRTGSNVPVLSPGLTEVQAQNRIDSITEAS